MHGLVARTLQCFLQDTYGQVFWAEIARRAELDSPEFEAMLDYEPEIVDRVLRAAVARLAKPGEAILEDIGTYLITHPNNEGLRRLMRYGGLDFIDFLHSLDDLPGRARLAVADLNLPELELRDRPGGAFELVCQVRARDPLGFGHVLVGVLRAMADDYGALVILDHAGLRDGRERIDIAVVQADFATGRSFDLGGAPGPGQGGRA
ncbi:heme NO-binding domain-containing protein [Salipiger bermudensis]|uniref:heme NO-binding domain-containing protein n=1 Tax=Salipiger bermudensis TaxID=344736 RepID=UPI001C9937B2|nr:heme NO-binding domain-containing protein [Salipiger bermudensis]MBY6004607.1 heme NO-binding domain-containing protein [Salipiger bermudensis]